MIEILTPRLIIRRPMLDDLDAIHSAKQAVWRELQNWMSWASDDQASLEATKEFIANEALGALCGFDRITGDFVVASGLTPKGEDEYETGYWVAPAHLAKGYATEATNALIRYAFNALNASAVHIGYFEGNKKSKNIIKKLGFAEIGIQQKSHRQFSSREYLDEYRFTRHNAENLPELEVTWS